MKLVLKKVKCRNDFHIMKCKTHESLVFESSLSSYVSGAGTSTIHCFSAGGSFLVVEFLAETHKLSEMEKQRFI